MISRLGEAYHIMASSNRRIQTGSAWFQTKINLRPQRRGIHHVTEEILRRLPELCEFSVGLCHIQILHTSASLALNENWDPDVRDDVEMMLNKIVPEGLAYRHSCEGPDDMVLFIDLQMHIKCHLMEPYGTFENICFTFFHICILFLYKET
ncbi:uncharacterized protein LOC117605824 isoform X3 [Osmia lignaria lignaria]|uniref:uncharacterized protein LOC117605824 isoform X3 n=1 Tax=Osmia lignaria lignaria TaxID=1437193 RepID=UPI00147926D2|nr:UPF0047 protein C4A8.02c isoform X3 [Osmia lignaria]